MTLGISSANVATPWLNFFRNTNTTTAFAGNFIQIHIGDPGAAGTANISVGSTTRVTQTLAAPSSNAIAQTGTAPVWTNTGATETLSHVSMWSAITAGTFGVSGALTSSQPWVSTNTFTLTSFSVGLSPIAA